MLAEGERRTATARYNGLCFNLQSSKLVKAVRP
jgi:hypothetical protein